MKSNSYDSGPKFFRSFKFVIAQARSLRTQTYSVPAVVSVPVFASRGSLLSCTAKVGWEILLARPWGKYLTCSIFWPRVWFSDGPVKLRGLLTWLRRFAFKMPSGGVLSVLAQLFLDFYFSFIPVFKIWRSHIIRQLYSGHNCTRPYKLLLLHYFTENATGRHLEL